ncbi:MAG: type II CRISPR RNA-guided endonuclease Cas9 [Elusimicrobiota bacterium]
MGSETEKFYNNIKEKIGSKDYRLGLDLGVGSIGFCILSLKNDETPDEIVLAGSRIFKPSEGGEERRLKRLQRNSHRHKRERLFKLWKLLSEKGLSLKAPDKLEKEDPLNGDTSQKRFPKEVLFQNVYILRYKALNEKLSLMELGYVIYHLANHRGTASLRTFEDFDENKKKENKEMQAKADNSFKIIKDKKYRTYGELIYKEKIEGKKLGNLGKIRNRSNAVEFIPTRDLILTELDEILKKQKSFYPQILTDDYIEKIKEILNFEYDKIIPEPGHCPYFPNEKKLPKAHPLSEERRLWEAINNSRVFEPVIEIDEIKSYKEREFNKEEKEKIFNELKKEKSITPNKIIKLLKLPQKTEIILQGRDKKNQEIKGYKNITLENTDFWKRFNEEQKDSFFYDWISAPDDHSLKKILKEKYEMSEEEISKSVREIEMPSGYSPIGKTATKVLTEYIKQGLSFTEAIDKAVEDGKIKIKDAKTYEKLPYYGEVLDDLTQPVICKALHEKFKDKNYKKPNIAKDEEKFGRIANPVVHQTLNELRKLVNEIIEATGKKPKEISLEVARELKKSAEERDKISREQNNNEKTRKDIYEKYLKGHEQINNGFLKFQLFEEQEKKCPYCGQIITADDIYNSRVDIDHIFPISQSLDNSRNNLVLSHNACNETKGQNPPYNIFSKDSERWSNILGYLDITKGMKAKKWRFMEGTFEEFIKNIPIKKRFETDTSYISKSAQRYLSCLFDKKTSVIPYKGGLTAQLRLAWDLNRVLIPYIKEGLYEEEKEEFEKISSLNMKFRMDQRHHAVDAVALAYATRGYSNLLNKLSAKGYDIDFNAKNWLSKILKPPHNMTAEGFSKMVKEEARNFVVSIKHDHDKNGRLIKDTFYKIYLVNDKYFLVSKKKVSSINEDSIDKIEKKLMRGKKEIENSINIELKKMLESNVSVFKRIKSNIDKAEKILKEEDEKAKQEGKKTYDITNKRIMIKALEITGGIYYDFSPNKEKDKFYIIKEPTKEKSGCGYDTGDNLCIDLYHDEKGKLCGEIIRKINAMNPNYKPEYARKGFKLFERIYRGDVLELDVSEDKTALKNKTSNAVGNRVFVKITTFTETSNYYKGKYNQIRIWFININRGETQPDDDFFVSNMEYYKPRKIILTSLGAIRYRSKILGDINVENNRYIGRGL